MELKYTQKSVINYSTFTLNEHHISLLSKGLKFCPTPGEPNTGELKEDLDKLHKQMRWTAFFENPEDSPSDPPDPTSLFESSNAYSFEPFHHRKFKLKSTSRGPIGPTNLEAFILANEKDFLHRPLFRKKYRNNLTQGEKRALWELKTNQNIIIRPADKG